MYKRQLTGGLAYEALNNAGQMRTNFIVILNDNEMSIAPNVGSMASYLSVLRSKPFANQVRATGKQVLGHLPLGGMAKKAFESAELGAMRFIAPSEKAAVIFEELGFRYIGAIDGHNYDALVDALETAKAIPRAVLLHVRTVKGKGYEPAERDSRTFHGDVYKRQEYVSPVVISPTKLYGFFVLWRKETFTSSRAPAVCSSWPSCVRVASRAES